MIPFDFEKQFADFLKMVGLDRAPMHPEQEKQLKNCFYGAVGLFLNHMKTATAKETTEQEYFEMMEQADQEVRQHYGNILLNNKARQN